MHIVIVVIVGSNFNAVFATKSQLYQHLAKQLKSSNLTCTYSSGRDVMQYDDRLSVNTLRLAWHHMTLRLLICCVLIEFFTCKIARYRIARG